MSLFYVTGLSGAGKSAVLDELVARGHEARGVDEDGYADWIDRVTGAVEDYAEDEPGFDFHAWYRSHNWVLSAGRIAALAAEAQALGRPVFLCGVADGDRAVWHLFDKVVALVIDVPTMRRRIAGRSNVFGQSPEEMAALVGWHAGYEEGYRRFGAVIIDATQPLDRVVDEVLAVSQRRHQGQAGSQPEVV